MKLKFKRLTENAVIPKYAHAGDSGMDVYSCEESVVPAWGNVVIHTGLSAEIPQGYELQLRPRSGLTRHGIVAAFGTIDNGYRGEIMVNLFNFSNSDHSVRTHERIGQLVLASVARADIEMAEEISTDTERGTDGFGSTGV